MTYVKRKDMAKCQQRGYHMYKRLSLDKIICIEKGCGYQVENRLRKSA